MNKKRLLILTLIATLNLGIGKSMTVPKKLDIGPIQIYYTKNNNPTTSIVFSFEGGMYKEDKSNEGLAQISTMMLTEGAGGMSAAEFQKKLDDNTISLNFSASDDYLTGGIKFLNQYKEIALDMLAKSLTEYNLTQESLDRVKNIMLSSLNLVKNRNNDLLKIAFYNDLFKDHPYSNNSYGTQESIKNITIEDVREYLQESLVRNGLKISINSSMSQEQLIYFITKTFTFLPIKPKVDFKRVKVEVDTKDQIKLLKKEEAIQYDILMVMPSIGRKDKMFYDAYFINTYLGRGFNSLLMQEIREKRGFAYSIYSYINLMKDSSIFILSAQTSKENIDNFLKVTKETLLNLKENGLTQEDINKTRTYILGSWNLNFTSGSKVANTNLNLLQEDLGQNYTEERKEKFNSITKDTLNEYLKNDFQIDKLEIYLVGPESGLINQNYTLLPEVKL